VNITELPFDSDNYSTAHPILSPDEKHNFVSDMPGTIGLSDLFKNKRGRNFWYSYKFGRSINTEGRETFPFVNETTKFCL
jgi:hypothetical protein